MANSKIKRAHTPNFGLQNGKDQKGSKKKQIEI